MKEALFNTICNYFRRRDYRDIIPNEIENSYILEGKISFGKRKRPFLFILPKDEDKVTFYAKIELGWPILFKDVKEIFSIVSNYINEDSMWDLQLDDSFCAILVIDPMYKIDQDNIYIVLDRILYDLNKFKLSKDFQSLEQYLSENEPSFSKK